MSASIQRQDRWLSGRQRNKAHFRRDLQYELRVLNNQLVVQRTNWVLDADIKSFFDNIDHVWMMKFVGAKIRDPRILRLIKVMLKAGIVKNLSGYEETEQGSGQ